MADTNGNGRADLVDSDKKADIVGFSRSNTVVAFSNGESFSPMTVATNSFGFESADGSWASQHIFPRMLGYVSDDSFIDIVACPSSGCYIALSNGINFQMPSSDPWIADFSTEPDGETSENGSLNLIACFNWRSLQNS